MIRIIGNRLLVKRLPVPEKTEGGLYMLGREYPLLGRVIAMGTGRLPMGKHARARYRMVEIDEGLIQIGDLIYFHKEAIRQDRAGVGDDPDLVIIDAEHCLARGREE